MHPFMYNKKIQKIKKTSVPHYFLLMSLSSSQKKTPTNTPIPTPRPTPHPPPHGVRGVTGWVGLVASLF